MLQFWKMFTLKGQVLGIDFLIIGIIYIICGCLAAISEVSIKIFLFLRKQSSSWFEHLINKRPNHEEDYANFCDFLRKAEL